MKAEDLWIGDRVRLLTSNRVGTYEGEDKKGKARVNVDGGIILTAFSNMSIEPEEEKGNLTLDLALSDTWHRGDSLNTEIDLHIERLSPDIKNALPQHILHKQLSACKDFLGNSIRQSLYEVTIIHGIGTGQLRSEVHHLIDGYTEVADYELINSDGATRVRFKI